MLEILKEDILVSQDCVADVIKSMIANARVDEKL